MTPDIAADPLPLPEKESPSTAGMTTKVVKGSIWTLGGLVVPLLVTFVATPFVIRFLGSEAYGVLLLVGLIPTYFGFADLGMGIASTRFAASAYANDDRTAESEIVWTAAFIAAATSVLVSVPTIVFADNIIAVLKVPTHFYIEGSVALRIAMVSFVLGVLAGIFSSPQVARLRMDLNTLIGAGSRILIAIGTPFVIYLGTGIIGATLIGLVVAAAALAAHIFISGRLLQELSQPSINRSIARKMLQFGFGILVSGIATVLLANYERILLTAVLSVQSLAYYSVAFTFANMTTVFGIAMVQSLVPAFSQLTGPDRWVEFNNLFSRSIRIYLICLPPAIMFLFVIARPFFTFWAGEEFGRESTVPFYILLCGLMINLVAFVPYSTITAIGRSDVFAKLYWIELFAFAGLGYFMVNKFGLIGAAASWSIRMSIDGMLVTLLAKRYVRVEFEFLRYFLYFATGALIMSPPMIAAWVFQDRPSLAIGLGILCLGVYGIMTWKYLVQLEEALWIKAQVMNWARRVRLIGAAIYTPMHW